MSTTLREAAAAKPIHSWLRKINVAFVPGRMTSLSESFASELLEQFRKLGHDVHETPNSETDVLLTTAPFGEPLGWREAILFNARRRFKIDHSPMVLSIVHATTEQLESALNRFEQALAKEPPDPEDFDYPGLAPAAHGVLIEQGRRGGPLLALERLLQAQTKSIRLLLLVGDDAPKVVYHFDLVGAHPSSVADDTEDFYADIVLRTVTSVSTEEVTEHKVVDGLVPRETWERAGAINRMREAALELDKRGFFTDMVRIADLVAVPAVGDAVASQYSEGCFATWSPTLNGLVATITGSARPVDKGNITEDDLALIVGVQEDGSGALVRHVEGKRNDPPSSEAVELMEMDRALPRITLDSSWPVAGQAPVVRSKLHGHRGVGMYDPERVEYAPLAPPYFHYLVSCATEAQAWAVKDAFSRSKALQNPDDPRQVVFTVLPGHGIVIAEKWVQGKVPFQLMWEAMDSGQLQVENFVPQGPISYVSQGNGRMSLRVEA